MRNYPSTDLRIQLERAYRSRFRALIVGAGVAGLTIAALLRRHGVEPVVVERAQELGDTGYMLGIYPLGGRVLHGLGAHHDYVAAGVPVDTYELHVGRGRAARRYGIGEWIGRYGDYVSLTRGALVRVLADAVDGGVAFATTVRSLEQRADAVRVTFTDATEAWFDVVIGADGLGSSVRDMVLAADEVESFDTGWGGWVAWANAGLQPAGLYLEFWGAGRFVGLYPVRDRLGVFVGGPVATTERVGRCAFAERVARRLRHAHAPAAAVTAVAEARDAYFWRLRDCRSARWVSGRVALLGDAAAGFLPTAGVGASMALDSATALSDELSRTDAAHIPYALRLYERRQRPRVEAAQDNSRKLARLMLIDSRPLAFARDRLVRLLSLERALADIETLHEGGCHCRATCMMH